VPEHYAAVMVEQVITEERWDAEHRPRPGPLIVPEVLRCSQVVAAMHGITTFVRCRAAAALGIHWHQLVAGAMNLAERRLLVYHVHGFPGTADDQQYRVPVDREEFDLADSRPWDARREASRPAGTDQKAAAGRARPGADQRGESPASGRDGRTRPAAPAPRSRP